MANFETKLRNFNTRYQTSLDDRAIAKVAKIKLGTDDFTFDANDEKVAQKSTYLAALRKALDKSLHAQTKIKTDGRYDLSNFDMVGFVREFEDLVQTKNSELPSPRNRKPFEGMEFDKIMNKIRDFTKTYDKPLYSIWANRIADGKGTYEDLKKVTDGVIKRIDNQGRSRNSSPDRDDLANVVCAHEAMFRVCQSRGFWWKAFHLYQNYKEQQYLESLSTRISQYIENGYPIDDISNRMSDSMMQGAYRYMENKQGALKMQDNRRILEKVQKELKEEEERNRQISSAHEQLLPVIEGDMFKAQLTDSIVKALPKCTMGSNSQKIILNSIVTNALINEAKSANKIFDAGIVGGENPQKQMVTNVKLVFGKAFALVDSLGYNSPEDQLLAAQKITDIVMKKASPAALKPEEYAKFTNGYVLNNPEEFSEITGMNGEEPAFARAKAEYEKESIQIEEVNSQKVEIAPRVNEQPKNDALIVNN